ncbi:SAP domain-containing protein [Artemisia annua]|uniref:SAP domain-containing protein n=1 Tax=Artemisia annua TaxID=35608 RepID=A0A2U1PM69_ARTAN|nr:SAP domain-containing protein [Artemisia annua]
MNSLIQKQIHLILLKMILKMIHLLTCSKRVNQSYRLSPSRKTKYRVPVEVDEDAEVAMPEFDVTDQKSGQVEKLKVEQCKLYLRKHGLRLTDKKDVLGRIKEHISIVNGEGELKYRASSFVMNFKGVIKYGRKLLGATDPQISEPEPSWVIWLLLNGMTLKNYQLLSLHVLHH